MNDNTTEAKRIIETNIYMVVATVSRENRPWISPVFYVYDDAYKFYWVSNKNARHSEYIKENGSVAISMYNSQAPEGSGDGVYIEAEATELTDAVEIDKITVIWNKRVSQDVFKITDPKQVTGEGMWRIYKAVPHEVSKLGKGTEINGQYIDQRIPVNLL